MERMVLAAILCIRRSPRARPQMSLVSQTQVISSHKFIMFSLWFLDFMNRRARSLRSYIVVEPPEFELRGHMIKIYTF